MLSKAQEAKMAKLTDTQSIVLSKAAAREDGAGAVSPKMSKAAAEGAIIVPIGKQPAPDCNRLMASRRAMAIDRTQDDAIENAGQQVPDPHDWWRTRIARVRHHH